MITDRRQLLRAAGLALLARSAWPPKRRARRSGAPFLDAHVHLVSPRVAEALKRLVGENPFLKSAAELVRDLDELGISRAFVLSEAYMCASDTDAELWEERGLEAEHARVREENDFVAREAAQYPDRLVPFLSVNPKRPYASEELERCASKGMKGLKLHLWNSLVDVRDDEERGQLRAVLARAAALDLPVVAHAFNAAVDGFGDLDAHIWVEELVRPLKDLRISFAHLGGAGGFAPPVQAVFEALLEECGPESDEAERVFVDMSAVMVGENTLGLPATRPETARTIGRLLEAWGLERVLWGSDNIPSYLELSRAVWPLSDDDWAIVRKQTGARFLVS